MTIHRYVDVQTKSSNLLSNHLYDFQATQIILSVGQTPANVKGYVVFGRTDGVVGQDASDFFGAFRQNEELVVIGGTAASYSTYLFVHLFI